LRLLWGLLPLDVSEKMKSLEEAVTDDSLIGCGTTSLNAMVRKIVAAQIDPARVAKGDVRGNISLINEDFAW
jgi:hypothetical protein